LSSFSVVSTQHFLTGFLSTSELVDLTLLISLWMPVVPGALIPGNLQQHFLKHFPVGSHFTYDSCRKTRCSTVYQTISTHTNTHKTITSTWCYAQLHCCVNNFSGSCCWCFVLSHEVPAGSWEVTVVFNFVIGHTAILHYPDIWNNIVSIICRLLFFKIIL
jgi:hypothetical protein